MWLSPVGVLTVIVVSLVVSVISNFFIKEKKPVDDTLILYRYKAALKAKLENEEKENEDEEKIDEISVNQK